MVTSPGNLFWITLALNMNEMHLEMGHDVTDMIFKIWLLDKMLKLLKIVLAVNLDMDKSHTHFILGQDKY